MFARWVDPSVRRSVAIGAVLLCIAGLVLVGRRPLRAATGPRAEADPAWISGDDSTSSGAPFARGGLRGRFALSHGRLLGSGRREVTAQLTLVTEDGDAPERHDPVSFVLVLDTSGSMAGQKIIDARSAALALLERMRDDDRVAVVRFSSDAAVVVPSTRVGQGRDRARGQIESMQAGGSTNIARALRLAADELGGTATGSQRIVLVTDGRDTSDSPSDAGSRVALAQAARGVAVSALGIGSDYDDRYLASLARSGRGNYEHVGSTSGLTRFVDQEFEQTAATVARKLVAELKLPGEARVTSVSGALWQEPRRGIVELNLGSLSSRDERTALVSFEVDAGEAGDSMEIAGTLHWESREDHLTDLDLPTLHIDVVSDPVAVERSEDHTVLGLRASLAASELELAAARAFETGDRDRAIALNREGQAKVARAAQAAPAPMAARLQAQHRAYQADADLYRAAPATPGAARSIGARESRNWEQSSAGY